MLGAFSEKEGWGSDWGIGKEKEREKRKEGCHFAVLGADGTGRKGR